MTSPWPPLITTWGAISCLLFVGKLSALRCSPPGNSNNNPLLTLTESEAVMIMYPNPVPLERLTCSLRVQCSTRGMDSHMPTCGIISRRSGVVAVVARASDPAADTIRTSRRSAAALLLRSPVRCTRRRFHLSFGVQVHVSSVCADVRRRWR
jgi:hypothetical protein